MRYLKGPAHQWRAHTQADAPVVADGRDGHDDDDRDRDAAWRTWRGKVSYEILKRNQNKERRHGASSDAAQTAKAS